LSGVSTTETSIGIVYRTTSPAATGSTTYPRDTSGSTTAPFTSSDTSPAAHDGTRRRSVASSATAPPSSAATRNVTVSSFGRFASCSTRRFCAAWSNVEEKNMFTHTEPWPVK
jgi:hypothetical protein